MTPGSSFNSPGWLLWNCASSALLESVLQKGLWHAAHLYSLGLVGSCTRKSLQFLTHLRHRFVLSSEGDANLVEQQRYDPAVCPVIDGLR